MNDAIVSSFRLATAFNNRNNEPNKVVISLCFSENGDHLLSSYTNNTLELFDCNEGIQLNRIATMKYGSGLIQYTHKPNTIIATSTRHDFAIRSLNIETKAYLSYFPGHSQEVISLCVNASAHDEFFVSSSMDGSVRLWDTRTSCPEGMLNFIGQHPVVALDPKGMMIAVGVDSTFVEMYDVRSLDNGPFVSFKINKENNCDWTGLKFSNNGKIISINTNNRMVRIIDSYDVHIIKSFRSKQIFFYNPISGVFQ